MASEKKPESNNLMRVTVQIGARRYDEDLAEQAMIRPDVASLNDALARHPSRFAEWAMLEALQRTEVDTLNRNVERLESDIKDVEAREYQAVLEQTPAGQKPPTVDAIKAIVNVSRERVALVARKREMEDAALNAKDALRKLEVGRKTMEEKRDSLMELSRNWRQEMNGKLQTNNMDQFKPGGRG
jgi:hypothetical protein